MDASKVTPIPEDMSYEEGAMIEPLAVAVHGVKQRGDVAGMNIAVLGSRTDWKSRGTGSKRNGGSESDDHRYQ